MDEKTEDNPSHKKFKRQLDGAASLVQLLRFAPIFGLKSSNFRKAMDGLPELKAQFSLLSTLPDKFNGHFAKRGWICYDRMNIDLLTNCIEKADKGNLDEAENDLIIYYTSHQLRFWIGTLNNIPEFRIRKRFIDYAYEDTLNEKYYSAVPILLMVMDGIVNDIDKQKGFFAEKTDMTAWDSIAAHSSGLKVLKEAFNSSRNTTSNESIDMPYRNGILHGRDLGYDNKITTAKCWLALLAVNEWARALKEGKRNAPEPEMELSFTEELKELQKSLDAYSVVKIRSDEITKLVSAWKPRNIQVGIDIPRGDSAEGYKEFTPEKKAVEFIECWSKQNFGAIAQQIKRWTKEEISLKTEAGKIRQVFEGKKLVSFEILNVKDCVPAISEVTMRVEFIYNNMTHKKEITLRMMYQDSKGENMVLGEVGGEWKYFPAFFHQIEFVD